MADATDRHEQQRRDALIAALQRERDGYLQYGRTERADQVAAVLAELGAPVAEDEPGSKTPPRKTSTKRRT